MLNVMTYGKPKNVRKNEGSVTQTKRLPENVKRRVRSAVSIINITSWGTRV